MNWRAHKLIYKACSPVHLGCYTLGYIKLTRPYITGKAVWGAATANMTRTYGRRGTGDYNEFGTFFKDRIIFSYFFPALDLDSPLLPCFTEEGIKYGKWSEDEFQSRFFGSSTNTAIEPVSNTAEDETLHESEYIHYKVKEAASGEVRAVFFVGYVFISDDASMKEQPVIWQGETGWSLRNAIQEIFVGGDIKYGWGRLILQNEKCEPDQEKIFDFTFKGNSSPQIRFNGKTSGEPIPAHLSIDCSLNIRGDIEPVIGRDWRNGDGCETGNRVKKDKERKSGAGQDVNACGLHWVPGSIVKASNEVNLKITRFGLLEGT
ncbi:MAG: hypothetical protein C4B57_10860 [Deltaproteobacteria bacterium]|nr:MAG: hypothetical protein C4B57_10860 [Deltaproteobacteria bacterium]